ncbi:hypothetical protein [Dictyobacter formicarum]|uniref:Uncharacterized protein n=1 Tax=Dictyobacter formicarum TaxID=2778368 RepID=A0ABQ3VJ37_9CHLR|nr:hypothetical protein [Dictyobacter formicarum]GHO85828.1 hypothetical protein KSZ_38340 [Dictyobacter formicarum]
MGEHLVKLEDVSAELLELVRASVEISLASIKGDEDLIPVLNIKSTMIVLQADSLDEARNAVQTVLDSSAVEHGVLLYNSYATIEGGQCARALLAEAYERNKDLRLRFAQYYRPSKRAGFLNRAQPLERIGELTFMPVCADAESGFCAWGRDRPIRLWNPG